MDYSVPDTTDPGPSSLLSSKPVQVAFTTREAAEACRAELGIRDLDHRMEGLGRNEDEDEDGMDQDQGGTEGQVQTGLSEPDREFLRKFVQRCEDLMSEASEPRVEEVVVFESVEQWRAWETG